MSPLRGDGGVVAEHHPLAVDLGDQPLDDTGGGVIAQQARVRVGDQQPVLAVELDAERAAAGVADAVEPPPVVGDPEDAAVLGAGEDRTLVRPACRPRRPRRRQPGTGITSKRMRPNIGCGSCPAGERSSSREPPWWWSRRRWRWSGCCGTTRGRESSRRRGCCQADAEVVRYLDRAGAARQLGLGSDVDEYLAALQDAPWIATRLATTVALSEDAPFSELDVDWWASVEVDVGEGAPLNVYRLDDDVDLGAVADALADAGLEESTLGGHRRFKVGPEVPIDETGMVDGMPVQGLPDVTVLEDAHLLVVGAEPERVVDVVEGEADALADQDRPGRAHRPDRCAAVRRGLRRHRRAVRPAGGAARLHHHARDRGATDGVGNGRHSAHPTRAGSSSWPRGTAYAPRRCCGSRPTTGPPTTRRHVRPGWWTTASTR